MNGSDGEHRGRDGGRGEQAAPKRHRIPRFDVAKPCSPPIATLTLPYHLTWLTRLYSCTCTTAGHALRLDMQHACTRPSWMRSENRAAVYTAAVEN